MTNRGFHKSFYVTLLETTAGRGIIFSRWGNRGQWGQGVIKRFENFSVATAYETIIRDKVLTGYLFEPVGGKNSQDYVVKHEHELIMAIGRSTFLSICRESMTFFNAPDIHQSLTEVEIPDIYSSNSNYGAF